LKRLETKQVLSLRGCIIQTLKTTKNYLKNQKPEFIFEKDSGFFPCNLQGKLYITSTEFHLSANEKLLLVLFDIGL